MHPKLAPLFVEYTDVKRQIADMDNALRDLNDAIAIMKRNGGDATYFLDKRRAIKTAREKLAASLPHWEQSALLAHCDQYRHFES